MSVRQWIATLARSRDSERRQMCTIRMALFMDGGDAGWFKAQKDLRGYLNWYLVMFQHLEDWLDATGEIGLVERYMSRKIGYESAHRVVEICRIAAVTLSCGEDILRGEGSWQSWQAFDEKIRRAQDEKPIEADAQRLLSNMYALLHSGQPGDEQVLRIALSCSVILGSYALESGFASDPAWTLGLEAADLIDKERIFAEELLYEYRKGIALMVEHSKGAVKQASVRPEPELPTHRIRHWFLSWRMP